MILASLAPPRRLDYGDVYLLHWHHCFERALCRCWIAIRERCNKGAWGDLPRHAPLVLTPAALAFLAAIEPNAGYANRSGLDHQDIALLAAGIVARRAVDRAYGAVGEGLGIKAS